MKDNILSIDLETSTAPIIKEIRGQDYVEYGTEDWANLYPQFLIDLYYNSSTHAAIINATAEMIGGEDLVCEEDEDLNLEAYVKLKKFLRHANSKESLHQVIKKVAFDFKLQGAYALHLIWNNARTEIAEVYHVPVERVRAGKPNKMGQIDTYFISADWSNIRECPPYPLSAFNRNDRTSTSQLLYTGAYSPNMDIYHTPDYLAGNNWALIDQRVAEFHLNNINNSFSGSYLFSFNNGVPTAEERRQVEQNLTEKFTSASNAGKFVLCFSDDRNRAPEVTPLNTADLDKQYLALQELLVQNILTSHRCTSPMLMGIKSDTGLGNNADELNSAANFYLNTVVKGFQNHILNTLQTIFTINNMDLEVGFVQMKPITTRFTNQDLMAVMTQDEIREELGLPPLNEEVEVKENFSKCSHDDEACEMKFSELMNFINEYGEDMPEDWELIDEEIVDNEHQDFDFEKELNDVAEEKLELAVSTGRANPNARSKQDGLNRAKNKFFKVRYVYTENKSVDGDGESRDFCRLMIKAGKVYRKEDILRMGSKPVNPGFGKKGAATYSIWLYKGGAICHHYWKRRIYQAPATDDDYVVYPKNITTNTIVTIAKARKEGFTIKKNDSLVAKAPKLMVNEGFVNPR